jgi:xanthosine utilization system XapX-like protein
MKNIIISVLASYIFYGFCTIRNPAIPIIAFLVFFLLISEIEEQINDFKRMVRRWNRVNKRINQAGRDRWTESNSRYL